MQTPRTMTVWLSRSRDRPCCPNPQRVSVSSSWQTRSGYPAYEELGLGPGDMAEVALSYFELAANDPEVVALIGYVWPGGLDLPGQVGARGLPENVQNAFRVIGSSVLEK